MKIILLTLLLFIGSCQKQSPSGVDPDYTDTLSQVRRGESCRRLNLLENIFELENLRNLFVCTTWEESFPQIFASLNEISPRDWDYISRPINNHFFNNRTIRDRSISLLKELDKMGGLDELGKVIASLSDSNFFHHVSQLLKCVENDLCAQAKNINKESVWSFYTFFKVNEEELNSLALLMRAFSTALKGEGHSFKVSLGNNLKESDFVKKRNQFLSKLFMSLGEESFRGELAFYEKLLIDGPTGVKGWLPAYITDTLNRSEFNYLNLYPVNNHKSLWKDFRVLEKSLEVSILCKNEEGDATFNVDISTHLNNFIDILFSGSQGDFFRNSLQSVAILKAANEVCPDLRGYRSDIAGIQASERFLHEVNFVDMMEKTTSLMINEKYYTLIRELHFARPESLVKDNAFLIRYFSDDVFASYVEMMRETVIRENDLSSSLYDLVRSFPDAGYPGLRDLFNILKEKSDNELKAISSVWAALGEEGRYFFFNFLDQHYKEDTNLPLLFDFYAAMLINAKESLPVILDEIVDEERKDIFFESIGNITSVLGRPELLGEYREFFSRRHLLEMIRVVSSGSTNSVAGASLGSYMLEEPDATDAFRLSPVIISDNITKNCLNDLVKTQNDFYALLSELPTSCLPLRGLDPLFRFFDEASLMAKTIGEQGGEYKTFTKNGFFSPGMVTNVTQILNALSKEFARFSDGEVKEGVSALLNRLSSWLNIGNRKENLLGASQLLSLVSESDHDITEIFSRFYGTDENFNYIGNLIGPLPTFFKMYSDYHHDKYSNVLTIENYLSDDRYNCSSYHQAVGGKPCPTKKQLEAVINRIITRATAKYDENPSALEQLVRMVASDFGLPIPYESQDPRLKRVTLEESFKMFYNFTNRELKSNKEIIKYRPLPKADEEYFLTPDWEVDRRQSKGAPDPYNVSLNTMERIEIVIRDVRFDENYLGAHYLNSVAKGDDYNKGVSSKYGLLKTCVPLKFCGKFMDKAQHAFAKNSRDTFPSLLDVNTREDWRHGDYMQALLTSLVSSSPTKSQVSTIVNKRIFGVDIEIPWLNAKKTLENHNGKILGLVSMVGMFTNSARVLRDRIGRTEENFQSFLNSRKLKQTDRGLLRNFAPEIHLSALEALLNNIKGSDVLSDFLDFVYGADYSTQRLWEQVLFKGVYLSSYLSEPAVLAVLDEAQKKRYENLSVLDYISILDILLKNHKQITKVLSLGDKDFLVDINHLLDVVLYEIENNNQDIVNFVHELAYFTKQSKENLEQLLPKLLEERKLIALKGSVNSFNVFMKDAVTTDGNLLVEVFNTIKNDKSISWQPIRKFLERSGARSLCGETSSGYYCEKNPEYKELQQIISYVFGDGATGFSKIISYITGANRSTINQFLTKVFPSINTSF